MSKLKVLLTTLAGWLAGRKTYILATLVCGTVGVLIFLGRLTPETGMAVALFALAGFAATFRSALAAHPKETLNLLSDIGVLGQSYRVHKVTTEELKKLAVDAVAEAQALAPEMRAGKNSGGATQ